MSLETINSNYLETAFKAIDGKFGEDTVIMDISAISILADYFIITTGRNANHNKAIADAVSEKLHSDGLARRHAEGYGDASWILLDFGSIIVHIFDKDNRHFYNIERVWADAPVIGAEQLTRER